MFQRTQNFLFSFSFPFCFRSKSARWYPWGPGRWWWSSSPPKSCSTFASSATETRNIVLRGAQKISLKTNNKPAKLMDFLRWPRKLLSMLSMLFALPRQRLPTEKNFFAISSSDQKSATKSSRIRNSLFIVWRTFALASLAASASAAMALCSWTGRRTSLLKSETNGEIFINTGEKEETHDARFRLFPSLLEAANADYESQGIPNSTLVLFALWLGLLAKAPFFPKRLCSFCRTCHSLDVKAATDAVWKSLLRFPKKEGLS